MGEEREDPQKIKRLAAAAYDYENDSRWADYWSNILIPPHLASRSDVVDHFKRKFYQRYIVRSPSLFFYIIIVSLFPPWISIRICSWLLLLVEYLDWKLRIYNASFSCSFLHKLWDLGWGFVVPPIADLYISELVSWHFLDSRLAFVGYCWIVNFLSKLGLFSIALWIICFFFPIAFGIGGHYWLLILVCKLVSMTKR